MDVFVARQPIFNKQQRVFGYELLYRLAGQDRYDFHDGDRATSELIANSFILIGLEALTGGKRAFINFTRNLLLTDTAFILPKDLVAIEILETIEVDGHVVDACRKLKQEGYLIVLDDFMFKPRFEPLVQLADIIKVDFKKTAIEQRIEFVRKARNDKASFLAEKVETREEFEEALSMGYSFFQGYFFSKPVVVQGRDLSGYKLNYFHILQEVNRPDADFEQIERIIKRDVALSYKLLKYINSAAYGFRTKISSIKHALVMLGMQEVKKWVSLIILRGMGADKPDEIMISSVVRARFGELTAPFVGMSDRSADLFLMGIFSMIDALLDYPLSSIIDELPISDDIKGALLGQDSCYLDVFQLLISYEKGDWNSFSRFAAKLGLEEAKVPELFISSVEWANRFLDLERGVL
ncbi:MAG: diguanylate phosphodiesterase [Firmicutes bacterium HGW-Firmicutes-14]|nr:MAG: diguanylate phosphodiesterase [Firmicutes bacterium HGW-Firmicutes-14]